MAEQDQTAAPRSIVHVVDHEDIGSVGAFSSRAKAVAFIESGDHTYRAEDLSITALVVDE